MKKYMDDSSFSGEYAPVLIPTLCRFSHFKNCVESLALNAYARDTDLFIALDYPLNKSHEVGYKQICEYIPFINGFKSVQLIKRESNYGAFANMDDAINLILQTYERFIFSEDDNVFSLNFLEFINKGLTKFKDDPTVFAINGYRHFYNIKFSDNNHFRQNVDFSAWGYGIWKDRWERSKSQCTQLYFIRAFFNPVKLLRVWRNGNNRLFGLISSMFKPVKYQVDNALSVYMAIEQICVIMPVLSKVRNTGWDGSGLHCIGSTELSSLHLKQEVDSSCSFSFRGNSLKYFNENNKIFIAESYGKISFFRLLIMCCNFYFQYILKKTIKSKNKAFGISTFLIVFVFIIILVLLPQI